MSLHKLSLVNAKQYLISLNGESLTSIYASYVQYHGKLPWVSRYYTLITMGLSHYSLTTCGPLHNVRWPLYLLTKDHLFSILTLWHHVVPLGTSLYTLYYPPLVYYIPLPFCMFRPQNMRIAQIIWSTQKSCPLVPCTCI